jgi:pantoate--beta-alanine ligase
MIIFSSVEQLKKHLDSIREQNKIIGFVPTMGALHKGHISLIEAAAKDCDVIISSVFVNPTQFNDPSDLEKYPRDIEKDGSMLRSAGCDILFAPAVAEMYSAKELEDKRLGIEDQSWKQGHNVDFGIIDKVMEGAQRPGHFNGVAQVVSKLFRIVQPHKAYFGQKDFQQLAVIRSMVKQLDMKIDIIACPILREPNGLAMSSRNERLSQEERSKAAIISRALFAAKDAAPRSTPSDLKQMVTAMLATEPLIRMEYVEIVDKDTLVPLKEDESTGNAVLCVAVKLGAVRLIDNMVL